MLQIHPKIEVRSGQLP